MDLPTILPESLKDASRCKTDYDLYNLLIKSTDRFVSFFSHAADDETWSSNHLPFMRLALIWFSQRYFEDRLADDYALEIAKAVQAHFSILDQIVPKSVALKSKEEQFLINPLIAGVMSTYLRNIIRRNFHEKNEKVLQLPEGNSDLIRYVLHYLESGETLDLYRWEEKPIANLLKICEKWRIQDLANEAERVQLRYINRDNCIDKLIEAQKQIRPIIRAKCIELINEMPVNARLSSPNRESLAFEFLGYTEKGIALFERLKDVITHLIVSGKLTTDEMFKTALDACPKLVGLDISGSFEFSPYLTSIPHQVHELNLSRCQWFNDWAITQIAASAPEIKTLSLEQDTHLNYLTLGGLRNFKDLRSLNLSMCHQIGDQELTLIMQAQPLLTELKLHGLRKLTDTILADLGRRMPKLQSLDLSRTTIADGALIEIGTRCKELRHIVLNHCMGISDFGVREFLKNAHLLETISLKESLIDDEALRSLEKDFPKVEIIF